ncbi:hypothetical protein PENARI_c318G00062 [Penicillium arizonense]|uniref:Uncharacterized protein n=1 Tax=Penicillium arizonense TaxID=1835702 RepID=A0A1F5L000_PENAI|nr:hypothetical protein PENARI_c318G00062 [Penicillium arizonense]OGE46386.1 hypothetical protein PENARI_c318G00062 [Penicillium arizonense]
MAKIVCNLAFVYRCPVPEGLAPGSHRRTRWRTK